MPSHLKSPVVTLLVGPPERETTITAHQMFLSRSPYFQSIFSTSPTRTIQLPNEDLDAIGCFLQFLYTGEYFPRIIKNPNGEEHLEEETGGSSNETDEDGNCLLKHARVYTLAMKFGVSELKHLAHAKIHRINSTAKGELAYARYVYANTLREDTTIRNPIASFWAHRSTYSSILNRRRRQKLTQGRSYSPPRSRGRVPPYGTRVSTICV